MFLFLCVYSLIFYAYISKYIYLFLHTIFLFNYLFWKAFHISFTELLKNGSVIFYFTMYLTSALLMLNLCGLQFHAVKNNAAMINFINVILHLYMCRKHVKYKITSSKSIFVISIDVVKLVCIEVVNKFSCHHECFFCHPSEYSNLHEGRDFCLLFICFLFSP